MATGTNLAVVRNKLREAKTKIEIGADPAGAQKIVEGLPKMIDGIVKDFEEKKQKNATSIAAFSAAVDKLASILAKTPFDGAEAKKAINSATGAAATAENTVG